MRFDYFRTVTALDEIDIEDIGNTCIYAANDEGHEYYLIIETWEGWTCIKEFGPIVESGDKNKIMTFFRYDMFSYEYSDKKISKAIDKFMNNPKRFITQVFEIEKEDGKEALESIKRML